jgi:hypothetical protein
MIDLENDEAARDAAYDYMRKVGLTPTPDAIGQLAGPFTAALEIICTRGYNQAGEDLTAVPFWSVRGWKGIVHDILDNALRLKLFSWRRNDFYDNGAVDIINFAGFYLRRKCQGPKWGEIGEPG